MYNGEMMSGILAQVVAAENGRRERLERICEHCHETRGEHSQIGGNCPNRAYRTESDPSKWGALYLETRFEFARCEAEDDHGLCGDFAVHVSADGNTLCRWHH